MAHFSLPLPPPNIMTSTKSSPAICIIQLLIASIASSTPQKNKQASKRQLQSPLATPRHSKRVWKEYNTLARARYFEALATRLERNKSIENIDKEHKISKNIDFRWRQHTSKIGLENAQQHSSKHCLEQSLKLFNNTRLAALTRKYHVQMPRLGSKKIRRIVATRSWRRVGPEGWYHNPARRSV